MSLRQALLTNGPFDADFQVREAVLGGKQQKHTPIAAIRIPSKTVSKSQSRKSFRTFRKAHLTDGLG